MEEGLLELGLECEGRLFELGLEGAAWSKLDR